MRPSSIAFVAIALLSLPARAEVRRGFFVQAELGAFATIGGRNTNFFGDADHEIGVCRAPEDERQPFPKKVLSNLQPLVSLTAGYDLLIAETFALSFGVRLSAAKANGAGRVTDAELNALIDDPSCLRTISSKSSDYSIFESGAAIEAAFMLAERFALTLEATGSLAILLSDPRLYAEDVRAGEPALAPAAGGALGLRYITRLEDLSIGVDVRFEMILLEGARIPTVSISIPVRYPIF